MKTLNQAYEEIARRKAAGEGSEPTRPAFDEVERILAEEGEANMADRVLDASAATVPWDDVAEVLGIMIWSTSDNGAGIMRDAERWLHDATDERRCFVALRLDVFPFMEREKMNEVLNRVATVFPGQAELCRSLISSRQLLPE